MKVINERNLDMWNREWKMTKGCLRQAGLLAFLGGFADPGHTTNLLLKYGELDWIFMFTRTYIIIYS